MDNSSNIKISHTKSCIKKYIVDIFLLYINILCKQTIYDAIIPLTLSKVQRHLVYKRRLNYYLTANSSEV